ncbi:MAG: hypothetical protein EYC70_08995 [Planctomycetota bacterium]|nr:MAG: hypothetical protein EYC70_08995 [Planctomycetota bacterium]
MAGRPYLYHYAAALAKSHKLCLAITRKELHTADFESSSKASAWEQFAFNADTLVLVTCVPLSSNKTYVHVLATSNGNAAAKKWAAHFMTKIKNSKMVMID